MEHLQIACDLPVIVIGLAALSIVVFWASRTGEIDLWNFSIPYLSDPSAVHYCRNAEHGYLTVRAFTI
jgi:hypothetical protein